MAIVTPGPIVSSISGPIGQVQFARSSTQPIASIRRRSSGAITPARSRVRQALAAAANSWTALSPALRADWISVYGSPAAARQAYITLQSPVADFTDWDPPRPISADRGQPVTPWITDVDGVYCLNSLTPDLLAGQHVIIRQGAPYRPTITRPPRTIDYRTHLDSNWTPYPPGELFLRLANGSEYIDDPNALGLPANGTLLFQLDVAAHVDTAMIVWMAYDDTQVVVFEPDRRVRIRPWGGEQYIADGWLPGNHGYAITWYDAGATGIQLYRDGAPIGPLLHPNFANNGPGMHFGGAPPYPGNSLRAEASDIMMLDVQLTAAQVALAFPGGRLDPTQVSGNALWWYTWQDWIAATTQESVTSLWVDYVNAFPPYTLSPFVPMPIGLVPAAPAGWHVPFWTRTYPWPLSPPAEACKLLEL